MQKITAADLIHTCAVCGRRASFGQGVALLRGRHGTWFCAQHRPQPPAKSAAASTRATDLGRQHSRTSSVMTEQKKRRGYDEKQTD